jgi:spore maturation protein CgeB
MKSDLKFLECAAHGVAALASPTVYEQSIAEGETGLLYRDPGEFSQKLVIMIEDAEFRRRITTKAYQWVASHRMLRDHYRQRYEWYLSMWRCLPELEHSMKLRLQGG